MKKEITLLIFFFFASSIFAQSINFNQGSIKQKEYLQKIPYLKVKGLPVVPVTIEGKTYNFLFDTGASPFAISDKLFNELNLPLIDSVNVSGSSGESNKMRVITLPVLQLQEITFLDMPGVVSHEESELFECLEIDGIIGSNMLRNSVVHFDEQNNHIIITNNIKNLSLQSNVRQKMKLAPNHIPYVSVTIKNGKKRMSNYLVMFDSGQDAFLTYSISTHNQTKGSSVVDKIAESEGSFTFGIHGQHEQQMHLLLSIPEFVVNKASFYDVVTSTTHARFSRIGAKLLEYGTVTLDYKKKHFYFNPYENIDTSDLSKRTWDIRHTMQNNKLVVGIIWDKALESQVNLGDEVLSINGIDFQSMGKCELFRFEIPDSEIRIFELRDINTSEVKTVEINRY